MLAWMRRNWRTTVVGVGYIGCNVGALYFPPLAAACPWIDKALVTTGFIAAADGAVVNQLNQSITDAIANLKQK